MVSACQEEIAPKVVIGQEGITKGDEIAEVIVEVAKKDGSSDNIIDQSSCTTIHFPIRGILNDEELLFNSLDEVMMLGVEVLEIDWIYPLQATLYDHSEIVLSDEDMLEEIQDDCIEGGDDQDNECIDFIYPFTVSVFNQVTENVENHSVLSDQEAFEIFSSEDYVININYPVSLTDLDGSTFDLNNNEALLSAIKNAPNCNEEDIIDFETQFETELIDLLIAKDWHVSSFEEGGMDKTDIYSGYKIQFNQDFTMLATGEDAINGEWEVELMDASRSVSIEFDTDIESFLNLNENWEILSFGQTEITLERETEEQGIKTLQLSAI